MMAFSIMGQNAATWKPVEGKHASIFGMHDRAGMSSSSTSSGVDDNVGSNSMLLNADLAAATNALRNVTITKATLLQCHNNFGVPLGVTINCLPKNEVIDTGDRYTFTTIPNTSINTPFTLYEAGESQQQAAEWRKTFGKFTASNLATQDVLEVPGFSHVFVHENHPVINLLRINKHIIGVDVDEQTRYIICCCCCWNLCFVFHLLSFHNKSSSRVPDDLTATTKKKTCRMDGQWIKITKNLFDSSCDTIKTRILKNMDTVNLNEISVQLHRMGGQVRACYVHAFYKKKHSSNKKKNTQHNGRIGPRSTPQKRSCRLRQTRRGPSSSWRPTSRPTNKPLQKSHLHSWPGSTFSTRCSVDAPLFLKYCKINLFTRRAIPGFPELWHWMFGMSNNNVDGANSSWYRWALAFFLAFELRESLAGMVMDPRDSSLMKIILATLATLTGFFYMAFTEQGRVLREQIRRQKNAKLLFTFLFFSVLLDTFSARDKMLRNNMECLDHLHLGDHRSIRYSPGQKLSSLDDECSKTMLQICSMSEHTRGAKLWFHSHNAIQSENIVHCTARMGYIFYLAQFRLMWSWQKHNGIIFLLLRRNIAVQIFYHGWNFFAPFLGLDEPSISKFGKMAMLFFVSAMVYVSGNFLYPWMVDRMLLVDMAVTGFFGIPWTSGLILSGFRFLYGILLSFFPCCFLQELTKDDATRCNCFFALCVLDIIFFNPFSLLDPVAYMFMDLLFWTEELHTQCIKCVRYFLGSLQGYLAGWYEAARRTVVYLAEHAIKLRDDRAKNAASAAAAPAAAAAGNRPQHDVQRKNKVQAHVNPAAVNGPQHDVQRKNQVQAHVNPAASVLAADPVARTRPHVPPRNNKRRGGSGSGGCAQRSSKRIRT